MGNATGGRRGAVIAGVIYGFLLIVGSAFLFGLFDFEAYGVTGVGHDCIDVMVLLTILKQPIVGIVIILAVFAVMSFYQYKRAKKEAN